MSVIMPIKKIVTIEDENGKSTLSSDRFVKQYKYQHIPGFATYLVWSEKLGENDTKHQDLHTVNSLLADKNECKLLVVDFPPDSIYSEENFNPDLANKEQLENLSGLIDHFEIDNPGMHKTYTLDFGIVLNGEITLELDDGLFQVIKQGEIVIQQSTRHAWRNHTNSITRIAFVMIGK